MNICGASVLSGSDIRDMMELNLRKFSAKWETKEALEPV